VWNQQRVRGVLAHLLMSVDKYYSSERKREQKISCLALGRFESSATLEFSATAPPRLPSSQKIKDRQKLEV
jgi:hypothetical protein